MADKMSKADKQAETARRIAEAKRYQQDYAAGRIPQKSADEEDIDDLLGNFTPKGRTLKKGDVSAIKAPSVPRISNFPMIAFRNKKGHLITGPGQKYIVVRDADGKLHYKEYSQVIFLPDTWQEGDEIPGIDTKPVVNTFVETIKMPDNTEVRGLIEEPLEDEDLLG